MAITLRENKGSPLTYAELDGNFVDLDDRINQIESSDVSSVNGKSGVVALKTTDIPEGTNLYYTQERFNESLANKTTNSLTEGSTNLYFTIGRARNSITGGTAIDYNPNTGVITLDASTNNVYEGTNNFYFTNARADARIALATANVLADVSYTSPTNGDVLTWDTLSNAWIATQPPGASGGEANTGSNIGAGQGIFASKLGVDFRFYTLAGTNGITISSPVSNMITISQEQDISSTGIPIFASVAGGNIKLSGNSITSENSNGNIRLNPNGTGNVIVDTSTANRIFYTGLNRELTSSANFTYNGTNVAVTGGLTVSANITSPRFISNIATGNSPFSVVSTTTVANLNVEAATTAGTVTTAAQPNITSVGTLTALDVDNININGNTISATSVNGNINLTANGTGTVVVSSLSLSGLTQSRLVYSGVNGTFTDNANLTFDGTTVTVIGNANVTTVNSTTTNGGNVRIQNNHIESTNTNGNIILNPNGTGNVGVKKTNPTSALDVTGTVASTGLTVAGPVTLGGAASDTISLTGRFNSTLTPSQTGTYDLGTTALKFRSAFLAGSLTVDGNATLGDNIGDSLTITAGINSSLLPFTTNTHDLGSASLKWKDLYLSGDINFSGGDQITDVATINIVNTTATTINFGGAATSMTTGATTGTAIYRNPTQIFGSGDTSATPTASTLRTTDGAGTNIVGANLVIRAGASTGNAISGALIFQTANASVTSGATLNSPITRVSVDTAVNVTANILPTATTTYNLGSTTARWNNVWGVSSSAQYADLAERYEADASYDVGTVVVFGGSAEITTTNIHADVSVAGAISENPAYLMNDGVENKDKYPAVALRGKVKVKCVGKVAKGDLLVTSTTPGHAESVNKRDLGNAVFAKSISDKLDEGQGFVWAVIL